MQHMQRHLRKQTTPTWGTSGYLAKQQTTGKWPSLVHVVQPLHLAVWLSRTQRRSYAWPFWFDQVSAGAGLTKFDRNDARAS